MVRVERSVLIENFDQSGEQGEPGVERLQRGEVPRIQGQAGAEERANVWREVTDVGGEKSRSGRRGGARLTRAEDAAAESRPGELQRG